MSSGVAFLFLADLVFVCLSHILILGYMTLEFLAWFTVVSDVGLISR